jgi:hypothetical protein
MSERELHSAQIGFTATCNNPSLLVDTELDQIQEQQMKIRMLSKEWKELVAQRKELSVARRMEKTIGKQERRNQHTMACRIQRAWKVARVRGTIRARWHSIREPLPKELGGVETLEEIEMMETERETEVIEVQRVSVEVGKMEEKKRNGTGNLDRIEEEVE